MEDYSVPKDCTCVGCGILDIGCGGSHCIALCQDGKLRVWGQNHGVRLSSNDKQVSLPHVLPCSLHVSMRVRSVAAGWSHYAFVTEGGEVYTCGTGTVGQLGHGKEVKVLEKATKIRSVPDTFIGVQVSCGLKHTLVLARDGKVWACGAGKRGQLGLPSVVQAVHELVEVQGVPKDTIRHVRAGGDRSALVTESGRIYCWGRGWNKDDEDKVVPSEVNVHGILWRDIQLGWHHAAALDQHGQCWMWGSNRHGQLGYEGPDCLEPRPVDAEYFTGKKVLSLATGSEHTLVLLEDGTLFTWGWGEHGQLGLGNSNDSTVPVLLKLPYPIIRIACGAGFSIALYQ